MHRIHEHQMIFLVDTSNTVVNFYRSPQEYNGWQDPHWSNNPDFAAVLGSIPDVNSVWYQRKADCIILNLKTKEYVKLNRSRTFLGESSSPYLWIGK